MTCPICQRTTHAEFRPFCSRRCADIDMGKWLGDGYAIPSQEPLDEASLEAVIEAHIPKKDY